MGGLGPPKRQRRSEESVRKGLGRASLKLDVKQYLSDPGIAASCPERMDDHAHLLVARARQLEPLGQRAKASMGLGNRLPAVVQSSEQRDQPCIKARSGAGHTVRVPGNQSRVPLARVAKLRVRRRPAESPLARALVSWPPAIATVCCFPGARSSATGCQENGLQQSVTRWDVAGADAGTGAAGGQEHATRLKPMQGSQPVAERPRRPPWMKVRAPSADSRYFEVRKLIHGQGLHTICEEARCPNISECWGRGTATFQILGDTCTRACRYCYVHSGRPEHPPDPLEPLRLAHAAAQMELKHVVVTSVDRDDLSDAGAGHYAATIRALKRKLPHASVEVLTPDFLGCEEEALRTVLDERPEVFNHNIETVRRLHRRMRGAKASYDKALWLLRRAKELADYPVMTKSGIIVGLGETNDEVVETLRDLRANDVDVVTIGQYLQPSARHATIDRWVHPDEFRWFREQGEALGFGSVFSGPLVRSSYRADEQRHAAETGRGAVAY